MPEQKIVISLSAADIQAVEQAVMDRDADAALEVLERIVHAQIQKALTRGHCRPVFEMERGTDLSTARSPDIGPGKE